MNEAGGKAAMLGDAAPYRPSRTTGAFMAAASAPLWARLNGYVVGGEG